MVGAGPQPVSVLPGLHEAVRRVVLVLEGLQAPYAVGGAVAMAFAGRIRGTRDVDVLAAVPALRAQDFAQALAREGFTLRDEAGAAVPVNARVLSESGRKDGLFRVWLDDISVDFFSPRVSLQDSILKRRRRVEIPGLALWLTTPEDLILLKMVFHRPKDLEDVRHLLAANMGTLDLGYLGDWGPKSLDPSVDAEFREMLDLARRDSQAS